VGTVGAVEETVNVQSPATGKPLKVFKITFAVTAPVALLTGFTMYA